MPILLLGTICLWRATKAQELTGCRIFLSGLFGDELFRLRPLPRAAGLLVRRGQIIDAVRLCYEHSLMTERPAIELFWEFGIRPNVPIFLRRATLPIPEWIDEKLLNRTEALSRTKRRFELKPGQLERGVSRFQELPLSLELFATERAQNPTSFSCWEMRYPFLHRPLIEFVLSLPTEMLLQSEDARYLQKAALDGILPEQIRRRTDKGAANQAMVIAINRYWDNLQNLLKDSYAADCGYVSIDRLRKDLELLRHGVFIVSDVSKFVALEMWLRALAQRTCPSNSLACAQSTSHKSQDFRDTSSSVECSNPR